MTLQELRKRTNVTVSHFAEEDSYTVTITYKGKKYQCVNHNKLAWDAINGFDTANYTEKAAYEYFYTYCKWVNHIGEYKC